VLSQPVEDAAASRPRHAQVEDHDVDAAVGEDRQRALPVARLADLVSGAAHDLGRR